MPGVIKGRKTADGGWEQFVDHGTTPAALNAKTQQLLQNVTPADPFAGREVVATFAAVHRDGTDAGVIKQVQIGATEPQQFAVPQPYFVTENDRRGASGDVGRPTAEGELAAYRAEEKDLEKVLDNPATPAV